jgi:hypothetical protein
MMFGFGKRAKEKDVAINVYSLHGGLRVGDKTERHTSLVVQRVGGVDRFVIAEAGTVVWVGSATEFSSLIRSAAHSATQVAEAA